MLITPTLSHILMCLSLLEGIYGTHLLSKEFRDSSIQKIHTNTITLVLSFSVLTGLMALIFN